MLPVTDDYSTGRARRRVSTSHPELVASLPEPAPAAADYEGRMQQLQGEIDSIASYQGAILRHPAAQSPLLRSEMQAANQAIRDRRDEIKELKVWAEYQPGIWKPTRDDYSPGVWERRKYLHRTERGPLIEEYFRERGVEVVPSMERLSVFNGLMKKLGKQADGLPSQALTKGEQTTYRYSILQNVTQALWPPEVVTDRDLTTGRYSLWDFHGVLYESGLWQNQLGMAKSNAGDEAHFKMNKFEAELSRMFEDVPVDDLAQLARTIVNGLMDDIDWLHALQRDAIEHGIQHPSDSRSIRRNQIGVMGVDNRLANDYVASRNLSWYYHARISELMRANEEGDVPGSGDTPEPAAGLDRAQWNADRDAYHAEKNPGIIRELRKFAKSQAGPSPDVGAYADRPAPKTLDELIDLIQKPGAHYLTVDPKMFIRWSRGPAYDERHGWISHDQETLKRHDGLQVEWLEVNPLKWTDRPRIVAIREEIAELIASFQKPYEDPLPGQVGAIVNPYIVTGKPVASATRNDVRIDGEMQVVALVTPELVAEALEVHAEHKQWMDLATRHGSYGASASKHRAWAAERRRARDMEVVEEKRQAEERKKAELGDNYKPMQATGFRSTDPAGETAELQAAWRASKKAQAEVRADLDAANPTAAKLRAEIPTASADTLVEMLVDLHRRPVLKPRQGRAMRGHQSTNPNAPPEEFWMLEAPQGPLGALGLRFASEEDAAAYALLMAYRQEDGARSTFKHLPVETLRLLANEQLDNRHAWHADSRPPLRKAEWGNEVGDQPWSIVPFPRGAHSGATPPFEVGSEYVNGRQVIIESDSLDGWSPKRTGAFTPEQLVAGMRRELKAMGRDGLLSLPYQSSWFTDTHVILRLNEETLELLRGKINESSTPNEQQHLREAQPPRITSVLKPVDPSAKLRLVGWMPSTDAGSGGGFYSGPLAVFEDPVTLARVPLKSAYVDMFRTSYPEATPWLPISYRGDPASHPGITAAILAPVLWTETPDPSSPVVGVAMPMQTGVTGLPTRPPTEADLAQPPKKKKAARRAPAPPAKDETKDWIGSVWASGGAEHWQRHHKNEDGQSYPVATVSITKAPSGRYEVGRPTGEDWRAEDPALSRHEYANPLLTARNQSSARKLAAELLGALVTHHDDPTVPKGTVRVPAAWHNKLDHDRWLPATLETLPPVSSATPAVVVKYALEEWKPKSSGVGSGKNAADQPPRVLPGVVEGARQGWMITPHLVVKVEPKLGNALAAGFLKVKDIDAAPGDLAALFRQIDLEPGGAPPPATEELRLVAYHGLNDQTQWATADGRKLILKGEQFDMLRSTAPKGELQLWVAHHRLIPADKPTMLEGKVLVSVDGKLSGIIMPESRMENKTWAVAPGEPLSFSDSDDGDTQLDDKAPRRRTLSRGIGIGVNAAVPPTARIDPLPNDGPVLRHSQARDRLVQRLDRAINIVGSRQRIHGAYFIQTGLILIQKANNPTTTIHEVSHWIDDRYLQSSQANFGWFDAAMGELVSNPKSSPHGGLNPPIPVADWNDVQRAEAIAEWIHNWAVAPDAAEKHSPKFAAYFKREVPEEIQAAVREYGDWIRTYAGTSKVHQKLANVRMEADSLASRVLATLKDLRDVSPQRDHRFRTSARDRIIIQLVDDLHLIPKAMRQIAETTGMAPRRPLDDPELLMRHHAGLNRKFLGIVEHGMIDANSNVVPETAGGLAHLLAPFRNTSAEDFRSDMQDAVAYMIAQRDLNRTSTKVPAHYKTPQRYDRERLRDIAGGLIWPEWDNDKASPEVVKSRRAWWRYRRMIEKAMKGGHPVNAEGVEALEQAFPDPSSYANKPKTRQLPPQFVIPGHYSLQHSPYLPSDRQVYAIPGYRSKEELPDLGGRPRQLDEVSGTGAVLATDRTHAIKLMQELSADPVRLRRARDAAARYRDWSNSVLDYLVATGRLNAEVVAKIKEENPLYVDMHRVLGQDRLPEPGAGQPGARKFSNEETVIHRLFGSDLELEHPYVNLLVQTFRAVREADRNRVLATFTKYLQEPRAFHGPPSPSQLASIGYKVDTPARGAVRVWRGGKQPEFWIFEAGIQDTLERWGDSLGAGNWLDQALQATSEFIRTMIVHMPDFGVRNTLRDNVQRSVQTGITPAETASYGVELLRAPRAGFRDRAGLAGRQPWHPQQGAGAAISAMTTPELRREITAAQQRLYQALAAAKGAVTPDVTRERAQVKALRAEMTRRTQGLNPERDLALTGGSGGGHYLDNQTAYHAELERRIQELLPRGKFWFVSLGALSRLWAAIMGSSEEVGRQIAYLKATDDLVKTHGQRPTDVMWRASAASREIIDFAVAGRLVRWLNRYIPFTSAQVAGLRAGVRAAKRNPALFAARLAMYVILPTVALWAATAARGKEELEEYRQLPSYQRDLFWNIRLAPDVWLSIPKPYDYAMLAAPIERAIDYAAGNKHAWDDLPTNAWNVWMPVDQNTITPAGMKLFLELAINKDIFRGRSIVPEYEARLDVSLRDTTTASRVAQILQELTGVDARQIDYAATSLAGTAARTALALSDAGRKDRPTIQRVLGGATGVLRQSPGGNAQDVQKAEDMLGRLGLSQSSTADMLKMARRRHSMATTPAEREAAARKLQEIGSRVRERLEEQQLQERIMRSQQAKRRRR